MKFQNHGIRRKRHLRKKVSLELIKQNIEIFQILFKHYNRKIDYQKKLHLTEDGQKIVQLFRDKVGYSKSTADVDIFNHAHWLYEEIKTGLNGHQRRKL